MIQQVVFVVSAEVVEGASNPRFLLGDEVLPNVAIRERDLRLDWAVGVDAVAAMNEEIRAVLQHRGKAAHAAARFVNAPALPGGVARPDKGNGMPMTGRSAE